MKNILILVCLMMLCGCKTSIVEHERILTGTVANEYNERIPGVTVFVKGSDSGIFTDMSGQFTIKVKKGDILIFSYVGLKPSEIEIGTQPFLHIVLHSPPTLSYTAAKVPEKMEVSGNVKDNSGMPMPGAGIMIKGTQEAIQSDFDGNFKLNVKKGDVVTVTYPGFEESQLKITNQKNLDIRIQEQRMPETVSGSGCVRRLAPSLSIINTPKTITGTIADEKGEPFPGVTVIIKGTNTGTQTDFDGKFSIIGKETDTLVFKYVGYCTHEQLISTEINFAISLKEDPNKLTEAVPLPYLQHKKSSPPLRIITAKEIEAVEK